MKRLFTREANPFLAEALPLISRQLADSADHVDRSGLFPYHNVQRLQQQQLLTWALPESVGGAGGSLAECRNIIAAVATGEPSTALILAMQFLNTRKLASDRWPSSLQQRVIHSVLDRGALINALRVEPELGTPARGGLPQTVATRTADGWRLNGRKIFSTGSHGLSWLLVWARSDDQDPLVGSFLVPKSSPGIRIIEDWDHLGMRATCSHQIVFENVAITLDHAVQVSRWSAPRPELDGEDTLWMAVLLGALYDAIAHAARDWLVSFLQQRVPANLGQPLTTLPRFQERVGQIDSLLFTSQTLLDSAARGEVDPLHASQIKQIVTDNAIRSVELAMASIGNHALTRHNPMERHWRNVLCGRIHTPQDDVVFINAGKHAFFPDRS